MISILGRQSNGLSGFSELSPFQTLRIHRFHLASLSFVKGSADRSLFTEYPKDNEVFFSAFWEAICRYNVKFQTAGLFHRKLSQLFDGQTLSNQAESVCYGVRSVLR